ncbi:cytochrome b [Chenggangzhangella methanolivorans]|uniref:Cytochrome b/b6 domain-containing protein n=1 Tax=Chenggangzhangella methanolivorans TaxID=1437009 RepID=A0A9E6UPQ4_9HYPH|nr:cytochrome b/b6 domain-containing protein [Chenggangzhangella methanolivorans]QZO00020.1 cytochrome b/b6 domain-containing protein [Chenggangzhangella methanolivorans]
MRPERTFRDTPAAYGRATRALHAVTAALVLWQFSIVALYKIFGESPGLNAVASFGPHGYVGLVIPAFALARILWALGNAGRRPALRPGVAGALAGAAHKTMYALMLIVPTLAVARVWAKGEGWTIGGVEIFAVTGTTVPFVVALADALHGPLSWVLLAIVGGHAAAALAHSLVWRDDLAGRMFGTPAASGR